MPERKFTYQCTRCGRRGHTTALYCPDCGSVVNEKLDESANRGEPKGWSYIPEPDTPTLEDFANQLWGLAGKLWEVVAPKLEDATEWVDDQLRKRGVR